MSYILLLSLIVLGIYLYKRGTRQKETRIQKRTTFEIKDVPDGYAVLEDGSFFVHGVTFRIKQCIDWASGKNLEIYHKREPKNKYDENAIAIYGKSSNGKRKLGYIEKEIAYDLVSDGLDKDMKIRLLSVKITDEAPFIEYDILVKEDLLKKSSFNY